MSTRVLCFGQTRRVIDKVDLSSIEKRMLARVLEGRSEIKSFGDLKDAVKDQAEKDRKQLLENFSFVGRMIDRTHEDKEK